MIQPNNTHCDAVAMMKVRSFILDNPKKFYMGEYVSTDECGTAGCIAGWAVMLKEGRSDKTWNYGAQAQSILGLTKVVAHILFHAYADDSTCAIPYILEQITPAQAVQAIDNVIADGMPHWQDILEDAE